MALEWADPIKVGQLDYVHRWISEPGSHSSLPIADLYKGDEKIAVYWGLGDETADDIIQHVRSNYLQDEELILEMERDHKRYQVRPIERR